jgi:hypothetical protein
MCGHVQHLGCWLRLYHNRVHNTGCRGCQLGYNRFCGRLQAPHHLTPSARLGAIDRAALFPSRVDNRLIIFSILDAVYSAAAERPTTFDVPESFALTDRQLVHDWCRRAAHSVDWRAFYEDAGSRRQAWQGSRIRTAEWPSGIWPERVLQDCWAFFVLRAEAGAVDSIFDEVTQLGPEVLLNSSRGLEVLDTPVPCGEPGGVREEYARQDEQRQGQTREWGAIANLTGASRASRPTRWEPREPRRMSQSDSGTALAVRAEPMVNLMASRARTLRERPRVQEVVSEIVVEHLQGVCSQQGEAERLVVERILWAALGACAAVT